MTLDEFKHLFSEAEATSYNRDELLQVVFNEVQQQLRQGIGGNQPPPLISEKDAETWTDRRDRLLKSCSTALENYISTDKDMALQMTELAKMCNVFCNIVESERKATKAPNLEQAKQIDAAFSQYVEDIQKQMPKLKHAISLFMDWEGEAQLRTERGALASAKEDLKVESVDLSKVSLTQLRKHISKECIAEAALALAKEKERHDTIKGVKFKKQITITIR